MSRIPRAVRLVGLVLALAAPCAAQAQIEYEQSRYNPAAYYRYVEPGDVPIVVNVWGSVRNPGLYEVPREMKMRGIISLAGGPFSGDIRSREGQEITIELSRTVGGERQVIYRTTVEDQVFVPEVDLEIQDGDVLVVERRLSERFVWRDVFPVISAAGSVIGIILALTR